MPKKRGRKPNGTQEAVDYKFEPWREKLRAAIVISKQSRRGLSLKAGLKQGYIRDIIAPPPGRKPADPTISRLHKLVTALDLTLDDIFAPEEFNTDDIIATMADRGFTRLFSHIKELTPIERAWARDALEQQLALLDKMPSKSHLTPAQIKLIRQSDSD